MTLIASPLLAASIARGRIPHLGGSRVVVERAAAKQVEERPVLKILRRDRPIGQQFVKHPTGLLDSSEEDGARHVEALREIGRCPRLDLLANSAKPQSLTLREPSVDLRRGYCLRIGAECLLEAR